MSGQENNNYNPDDEDAAPLQLFAKREKAYPKAIWGRFRQLKWIALCVTLGVYYFAPFLRWDRGPNAPDQAILIDMPARRAYWFFIEIWPQEVYYLVAILVFAAVTLFFLTSLLGRVWCGYFCPQTVWTDLYVLVERWVQGDRAERIRRDKGPINFDKIWRKVVTHLLWILIGMATGGAFVFYFNDAPTLWGQILTLSVPSSTMTVIGFLTFSTYIMAGWARENVCVYMCPYARFQSAMFDPDTLVIGYDADRGEPRGKHKKGDSWEGRGHCVSCQACVQVCPTGIDIRDGLQLDCIACGLCIDACDQIMDKVGLPRGLIDYNTERNLQNRRDGKPPVLRLVRPRTIYYACVLTLVAGLVLFGLITRKSTELHVLHDRNPLYVQQSDGHIRNGYDIKILNKAHVEKQYRLTLEGLEGASMELRGAAKITPELVTVPPDTVGAFRLFVSAPAQSSEQHPVTFVITDLTDQSRESLVSKFVSGGKQ